ncbi:T9SS type A sorting domain-containing protein, partial [candidate division KSB1 bacterium]|nr:T9SS type A sorting domain-containing protein [candidate division KSB1 bacterium]
FVWADTRNYGQGYDIYGSIHDLIKITPVIHADDQTNTLAGSYLERIYPNPFNTSTTIKFFIINDAMIHLEIYNIMGKKVRTLLADQKPAGHYEVQWDGTDELKQSVASGIYFCRLQASTNQSSEAVVQVRKLMLLR